MMGVVVRNVKAFLTQLLFFSTYIDKIRKIGENKVLGK